MPERSIGRNVFASSGCMVGHLIKECDTSNLGLKQSLFRDLNKVHKTSGRHSEPVAIHSPVSVKADQLNQRSGSGIRMVSFGSVDKSE